MKKYLRMAAGLILAAALLVQQVMPVRAWNEVITCTVLGDSIAKGYSSDKVNKIKCYGRIVTEQLAEENEAYFDYQNYAKNGLDTAGLNEKVLSRDTVKRNLNKSDIVLITMGSNDLLNEFKHVSQQILNSNTKFRSANQALSELQEGVKKNPLTILKIVDALSNWDYGSFETEWMKAMETVSQQKKKNAQVIVTNIYNPVYNMELPGTLNKVVENIIGNMNSIIEKRASDYGYQVVDLFNSSIVAFVQGDGLHPSQEGQELIAGMVYKLVEDPDSREDVLEEDSQSVDGGAVKGEAQDKTGGQAENRENAAAPDAESENVKQMQENQAEKTENEKNLTDKQSGQQEHSRRADWLGIAAGVILAASGICLLYLMNRKKKG
ncbi:hypothetical protein GCM10008910_50230 [Faecalicatena orotica]|uniref:Lysophospholipase L1-like esterase n=1 Tax=Faecalicatena orotica TaxID=1544 RepID=A0A2Y9BKF2_9FIRM|nr:GDSL-type esterase/lipase family protein [Faecalicatena orotica]PWJ27842.1 lysophospholipase L1-like esterase [Faecalicatena orotica]SSA56863.1 Lysophospholipase L1 [Faecalicatena orotica]